MRDKMCLKHGRVLQSGTEQQPFTAIVTHTHTADGVRELSTIKHTKWQENLQQLHNNQALGQMPSSIVNCLSYIAAGCSKDVMPDSQELTVVLLRDDGHRQLDWQWKE